MGNQIVYRTRGDLSIIAAKPKKRKAVQPVVSTQAAVKRRFRIAVIYATRAMDNPAMKEAYENVVRGNQSAYNVAFADAFKGPELSDLNVDGYKGDAGQPLIVTAIDNFRVAGEMGCDGDDYPATRYYSAKFYRYGQVMITRSTLGSQLNFSGNGSM